MWQSIWSRHYRMVPQSNNAEFQRAERSPFDFIGNGWGTWTVIILQYLVGSQVILKSPSLFGIKTTVVPFWLCGEFIVPLEHHHSWGKHLTLNQKKQLAMLFVGFAPTFNAFGERLWFGKELQWILSVRMRTINLWAEIDDWLSSCVIIFVIFIATFYVTQPTESHARSSNWV